MIGKAKAVGGSANGIGYLMAGQKEHPELVKGYELSRNMVNGQKPGAIMRELKQWNEVNPAKLKNKVFTMVLSPSIGDGGKLSDAELTDLGRSFIQKTLGVEADSVPYYMYVHDEKQHKHVHIYVPRTDAEGQTISDKFVGRRASTAADELAAIHGLERASQQWTEKRALLTKAFKETLSDLRVTDFEKFRTQLSRKGVELEPTVNRQGVMQGYRVKHGITNVKASEVGRDFTMPKLRDQFAANTMKLEQHRNLQQTKQQGRDRGNWTVDWVTNL